MVLTTMDAHAPLAKLVSKAEELHRVLAAPTVDMWKLRELSLSDGGLVDDAIRKKAWPLLVGIDNAELVTASATARKSSRQRGSASVRGRGVKLTAGRPLPPAIAPPPLDGNSDLKSRFPPRPPVAPRPADDDDFTLVSTTSMGSLSSQVTAVTSHTSPPAAPPTCLDAAQVSRDVARCTWHLLTGSQRAQRLQMEYKRNKKVARHIHKKQERLGQLICDTLVASYETPVPLRYYQGYHDVACIVLSTLQDMNLASRVLLQISYSHLRDCCNPDFQSLQLALHLTVMPMLQVLDPTLHHKLMHVDMTPYFCLSWILTWFAHDVRDTALVKRLFDAFLASHAMLPTYVAIAMLIRNRQEILECESDFSLLHQCLCGLPKNSSRVGWKYRPGEGYVTDEEHGGTTVSTTSSMGTADFLLVAAAEEAEHSDLLSSGAPTTLLSSISSLEEPSLSFEKLIQEAIGIMEQIPPSRVATIREHVRQRRWFASCHSTSATAAELQPLPRMLQEPPFWAVRQFANRITAEEDSNRRPHGRKRRSRSRSRTTLNASRHVITEEEKVGVQDYLNGNKDNVAVIAAGYGSGRSRTTGSRFLSPTGTIMLTVAVVAVVVGVMLASNQLSAEQELTDSEAPNSNGVLVSPPETSGGEILAVSALVESLESASVTTKMVLCTGCAMLGEHASSGTESISVPEMESEGECSALKSLQVPIAPQDYHLTGLDDYKMLFSVVKRQCLLIHRYAVIGYSQAMPYLVRVVKLAISKVREEYFKIQVAFKHSTVSHHVRRASTQTIVIFVRCEELAKIHQRRIYLEVSRMFHQTMKYLEYCKERTRPHLQDLSNGFLHRIDGAAMETIQRFTQILGESEPAKRLGEVYRLLAASPMTHRMGEMYRNITANPVASKVMEISVGLIVDASLTSLYG